MHKCSENLLWVCDLFYGFDRKMSYKDIPEKFQPTDIVNNRYYFPDGVYSIERDRLITHAAQVPAQGETYPLVVTLPLIAADDDTPEGQTIPRYINGVRRVRNIRAHLEIYGTVVNLAQSFLTLIFDIIVIRQGQVQAFDGDVLATQTTIGRISSNYSNETEVIDLCYPGYVDLNGGDSVIVRVSMTNMISFNRPQMSYHLVLCASALVRFA